MSRRYYSSSSSSSSSENDLIDRRGINLTNRHDEYSYYSKSKPSRQTNRSKYIERVISQSSETNTEEEIDYYWSRNGSSSRRDRFSHLPIDVYRACHVTIHYNNHSSSKTDQILVKQKQNTSDRSMIVYKGYLQSGEIFSFKSEHLNEYPFDIRLYLNGEFQTNLLTCCEYKYRQGEIRLNHLFTIQQIEKAFPCTKCRKYRKKDFVQETIEEPTNQIESDDQNQTKEEEEENESPPKDESPSNQSDRMLVERSNNDGENSNDQGNLLQSILAFLQQGVRQASVRQPLPPRYQGNVENFVVLLVGMTDQSNLIGSICNFVKRFENVEELNPFVGTLKLEKIILIISDSFSESIEDYSQFDSIYLLSSQSKLKVPNLRGISSNMKSLSSQVIQQISNENDLFSIESSETSNQSFTYSQLLKETILMKDNEGNLKKDFIDYCRFHYQENQIQLQFIQELEKSFTPEKSIWWLTRNTFLKRIISRALRTQEVDILFKIRWIIQTINQQIKENSFSKIVYRLVHLSKEKFHQLKDNSNGLISFGTFLDCSLVKPSSIDYFNEMETILFQIETTNGIELKSIRHDDSTIEVLLSFDNIYQMKSIKQLNEHYFIINLTLIEKENEFINQMRNEIQGPVVLIQLAKLLISNDDYLQADYFARLLFADNSLKGNPTLLASLAAVHHLLGSQDHRQNNHRAARLQFEQSLQIFLTFIPEENQILSATYNNIGSMFYQEDQHEQAIHFHQKALQCQLKSSTPDIEAIATYSGNIGAVYLDQKKYDQALINYKRSLHILQQAIPGGESQSIAAVYDRIASIYWRMDQPEQALPFYQKSLQLELKFLPENDHKISVSYFNLSTAYAKLNQLDDAIDCAEKSIQQLLKSVPPDHPEVKENTEQLEGLRRKKWIQQLYQ